MMADHHQMRLDGRPDFRRVPRDRRARAILAWYEANPKDFVARWGDERNRRGCKH